MAMIIRRASKVDFSTAVQWAADEGWNPGLDDIDPFFSADTDGFLMGFDGDEPVASISVVRYGQSFGFLGYYIVAPSRRGEGLGMQIWNAGLTHLEGRTIGLDGVVAQQDNYRKSGFVFAHNNIRYCGTIAQDRSTFSGVISADDVNPATLLEYDSRFFPDERTAFSRAWYRLVPHRRTTLVFTEDGKISGLGTIRKCRTGHKIGPLFADRPNIARTLFLALAARADSQSVILDVPHLNDQANSLAIDFGLEPVFETARMYRGNIPELPLQQTFGVTTFELG
jgi:hypothetical protein